MAISDRATYTMHPMSKSRGRRRGPDIAYGLPRERVLLEWFLRNAPSEAVKLKRVVRDLSKHATYGGHPWPAAEVHAALDRLVSEGKLETFVRRDRRAGPAPRWYRLAVGVVDRGGTAA